MFQSEHLKTGTVWQAEKTVALPKRAVYIQEQEGWITSKVTAG